MTGDQPRPAMRQPSQRRRALGPRLMLRPRNKRPRPSATWPQHMTVIATLLTALTAVTAVTFTGLQLKATREGQFTDRFTRAVQQLSDTTSALELVALMHLSDSRATRHETNLQL